MTREGFASNYNFDERICKGPGCQCSDQQLEMVGCECRAQEFSIVETGATFAIEHRDPWTHNAVICMAGIVSREAAAVFVDELVCDPTINCQDPVKVDDGSDELSQWDQYQAYLAEHGDGDSEAELAADRGPVDHDDPEALADLELHDALHPFGYGRDAPEPPVFVIYRESTNEWAGFRFPSRFVSERPDAQEFGSRRAAMVALRTAQDFEWPNDHLVGFEVVECQ